MSVPLAAVIRPRGELHRFVLETFATAGRSPALEEIRARFQLASLAEAEAMVAALEATGAIHRNPGDTVITHAYPFSNDPTAHRVHLAGGPDVYAMCAVDALGMPFMLRRDADIASVCESCGADVTVALRDGRAAAWAPGGITVWMKELAPGCCPATDLCPDLNFFCSTACAARWAAAHPEQRGDRLDLARAMARGRQVFEGLLEG
jgi:hypothetical protein